MSRWILRESIAAEAARLLLRGKETGYAAARKRAARWLSRRKLRAEDIPSNAEIDTQLHLLAGLFHEEQQTASLAAMREDALEIMNVLAAFGPQLSGPALEGGILPGAEITISVTGTADDVRLALRDAGYRTRIDDADAEGVATMVRFTDRFPCCVTVDDGGTSRNTAAPTVDRLALARMIDAAPRAADRPATPNPSDDAGEGYHSDVFPLLRILLERLGNVRLDPERHPEGDALYHSLQVYQLGLEDRPYDEEFLLACLLHDVGLGIDRRDPVTAALESLQGVLTDRTCELIRRRPDADQYLRTGQLPRSLSRSEDFEELVLLAQLNRRGRVRGAQVPTIDEALEYLEGLGNAWDEA